MSFALFGMIIFLLAVLVILLLGFGLVRACSAGRPGEEHGMSPNEEETLREFQRGLEKMDQRLENLETILLERAGQTHEPIGRGSDDEGRH